MENPYGPSQGDALETCELHFSSLPRLQEASTVLYALCGRAPALRIEIARCQCAAPRRVNCPLPGVHAARGRALLRFLWENAVGPDCAADLLDELLLPPLLLPRGLDAE